MPSLKIDLIVDDKGELAIKTTEEGFKKIDKAVKETAASMGKLEGASSKWNSSMQQTAGTFLAIRDTWVLAAGAIGAAWASVSKAMAYMEEGAKALQIESSFRIIAEESGVMSEQMIANMKKATRETIDDSDMMQKSVKLMLAGYNPDQIERFSKVAITASQYMGTSVGESFEKISDALASRMPKAMVQAGAVTREQMAIVSDAIKAGADSTSLMDLAIANLEVKQLKLKGTQDDAAISMQRYHAHIKETGETIGKTFIAVLGQALEIMQKLNKEIKLYTGQSASTFSAVGGAKALWNQYFSNKPAPIGERASKEEIAAAQSKVDEQVKGLEAIANTTKNSEALDQWTKKLAAIRLEIEKSQPGLSEYDKRILDIKYKFEALYEEASKGKLPTADLAALQSGMLEAVQSDIQKRLKEVNDKGLADERQTQYEVVMLHLKSANEIYGIEKQNQIQIQKLKRDMGIVTEKEILEAEYAFQVAQLEQSRDIASRQMAHMGGQPGYAMTDEKSLKEQLALYGQIQAIDAKLLAAHEYFGTQIAAKEYQAHTQTLEILKQTYAYIPGAAEQAYGVELALIRRRTDAMRAAGIDIAAIEQWAAAESEKAWIAAAQSSNSAIAGMSAGLLQYAREASRTGKSVSDAIGKSLGSVTDALVDLTMTGTADFAKLADSIVRDLLRIGYQAMVTGPIAKALGDMLKGISGEGDTAALNSSLTIKQQLASATMEQTFAENTLTASMTGEIGVVESLTVAYIELAAAKSMSSSFGGGSYMTDMGAMPYHTGGMGYESPGTPRSVPAWVFAYAPRYHSGIGPGERPAVIRTDEAVFTPGQMRALGKSSGGNVTVNIINNADATVSQSERQTSKGVEVDVIIDKMVAGKLSRRGTSSNKALRQGFNAQQGMVNR